MDKGTVLLVDDERQMLYVGRRLLETLGYSVLEAQDGEAAVEVLTAHQATIQVVILDLVMPRMDGADTLAELRRLAPEVPVVLTSGGFGQQLPAGLDVDGFLPKPFRLDQVEALLSTIEKRQGCPPP